jgi:hypothetical protein
VEIFCAFIIYEKSKNYEKKIFEFVFPQHLDSGFSLVGFLKLAFKLFRQDLYSNHVSHLMPKFKFSWDDDSQ